MLGLALWLLPVAFAAVVVVYDIRAIRRGTPTVSWRLFTAARTRPIVAALLGLIFGILAGHLFWPNTGP